MTLPWASFVHQVKIDHFAAHSLGPFKSQAAVNCDLIP